MFWALAYSPRSFLIRRIAARTCSRLFTDPVVLVSLLTILVVWLVAAPSVPTSDSASRARMADEAAEQYMRALRNQDPTALLASLSSEVRHNLEQRLGPLAPSAAAAVFREQQRRGERIVDYRLVGRHETAQGESIRFYVAVVEHGPERREVPYTLTVGPDGKVSRID